MSCKCVINPMSAVPTEVQARAQQALRLLEDCFEAFPYASDGKDVRGEVIVWQVTGMTWEEIEEGLK